MKNTIILACFLFIAVVTAAVFFFRSQENRATREYQGLRDLPEDLLFVSSFKNDKAFERALSTSSVFSAVLGTKLTEELKGLKQLTDTKPVLTDLFASRRLYFSVHPEKNDLRWLIVAPLSQSIKESEINDLLTTPFKALDSADERYFSYTGNQQQDSLFLSCDGETIFISSSIELLKRLRDPATKHLSDDDLARISAHFQTQDQALLSMYIQNREIYPLLRQILQKEPSATTSILKGIDGWSAWSLNFRSDALMLRGDTHIETDSSGYLSLLNGQTPLKETLKFYLPHHTSSYFRAGFSDFERFHERWKERLVEKNELARIREQFRLIRSSKKVDIDSTFLPLFSGEYISFELSTRESVGMASIGDSSVTDSILERISSAASGKIRRLDHSNLLYYTFGEPLKAFQRPYFCVYENFILFANTLSTLEHLDQALETDNVLRNSATFVKFSQLESSQSNISWFISNTENTTVSSYLDPSLRELYQDSTAFQWSKFKNFSVQLNADVDGYYTNFTAQYDTPKANDSPEEEKADWNFTLNGHIASIPQVFRDMKDSAVVLIQDKGNRLYALSSSGNEQWHADLDGVSIDRMEQLPDRSILLTTANKLYRFQPDGSPVQGFPVSYTQNASAPATAYLGDSSSVDDYRFFIPCNSRVLAFDDTGKPLDGWKNVSVDGDIKVKLVSTLLKGFNYVIATSTSRKTYYFNYNGDLARLLPHPDHQFMQPFEVQITPGSNQKSRLIGIDQNNKPIYLFFDGKIREPDLDPEAGEGSALLLHREEGKLPNLIVFTDDLIQLLDVETGSVSKRHNFSVPAKRQVKTLKLEDGHWLMAFSDTGGQNIQLFDENLVSLNTDMAGVSGGEFTLSAFSGSGLYLLMTTGSNLSCYKVR